MVGCCGQGGQVQNSQNKRSLCGSANTNNSNNKCIPGANNSNNRGKYVSHQHDEEVCHGTGERRRDLLDQLKIYLSEFDEQPCTVAPRQDDLRPLGEYPEYIKKHCQSWMPPSPRPPLITSVQTHEIRATSDYGKMVGETSEYISFSDATLKPPVFTCDCVKRNGLQDECPHPMCKPPTAQCKANNPGPCCPPSLGLAGPDAVLGGSKGAGSAATSGAHGGGQGQGPPPPRSEYQDAFVCGPTGNQQQAQLQSPTPSYTTTYRQDYRDRQPQQGAGVPQPPPGMEMACVCQVPSSALPSGKKYLCIPLPQ